MEIDITVEEVRYDDSSIHHSYSRRYRIFISYIQKVRRGYERFKTNNL